MGECCLYNADCRTRMLSVGDSSDRCEDARLADKHIYSDLTPSSSRDFSVTQGFTRTQLLHYSRTDLLKEN